MQHLLILLSAALAFSFAFPASGQRYWALMRDGTVQTGNQLKDFDDPKRSISLDGRKLLEISNPVRSIRDTKLSIAQPIEWIELTNGDVLAGRIIEAVTGDASAPLPDYLVIGGVRHTGDLRVRLDWVRRIVTGTHARQQVTPLYLRLTNGSEPACQSIRWMKSGIKVLTDSGVESFAFNEIAELHLGHPKSWQPIYPAATWLSDQGPSVVRIVTVHGQAISFPQTMVTTEFDRKLLGKRGAAAKTLFSTRPPWAIDLTLIDSEDVAWQSYFAAGEVPLSLLPVVDVQQKAGLYYFPWRRDQSVRGGRLHSGEISSELGIGVHAYTRLTFKLPPRAKTFTSRVGLNHLVGSGGCVHCRVWRDEANGSPLWERKFLRGSDGIQRVGPLNVSNAKRLILEVDFANDGRPQGADPLDVRDSVDWLMPIITVDQRKDDMHPLTQVIPEIAGWTIPAEQLKRIKLRPAWVKRNNQWGTAIVTGNEPLVISRKVEVSLNTAWLPVRATCDDVGGNRMIWVRANGQKVNSTAGSNLGTFSRYRFGQREYSLCDYTGETATVEIVADPHKKSSGELGGVVWDWLRPQPLIQDLPPTGQPIRPNVALNSLKPTRVVCKNKPLKLLPGKLTNGNALTVHGWQFEDGFGVPALSEITYQLDPTWHRFVAVIGLAEGTQQAGPFQILLDNQLHWSSETSFTVDDPGKQISIPIPPGHENITLRTLGANSFGAWIHAGFLTR